MVANVSTPKKCPANARSVGNMQTSVLLSPISVAHRSSMPEGEGTKKGSNWMRDQWVANLKKKRMANAGNGVLSGAGSMPSSSDGRSHGSIRMAASVGASGLAANRRHNAALEKSINSHHRNQHKHSQFATVDAPLIMSSQLTSHDAMHPTMMFNDIGFFEIESQSFEHVFPTQDAQAQPPRAVVPPKPRARSGSKSSGQKKNAKPLLKKRTTNLMLEVNQAKPRTPRRKLNTGDAFFDDYEALSSSAPTSPRMCMAANGRPMSAGYSSVGTPSNFNAEIRHMWGPEFDFSSSGNAFADTFLDLPTPKSAEMPFVTASCQPLAPARTTKSSAKGKRKTKNVAGDASPVVLNQPRLIRTSSIEQEGLSHFLEQTNLDGSSGSHGEELFQLIATPRTPGALRHRSKSLDSAPVSLSSSSDSGEYAGYSTSVAAAVNECFGKASPTGGSSSVGALLSPRGIRPTPRGWYAGDFSFDQKSGVPEFETLLDEYKLSDIDQELDSFYLDAMESLGGELDLLSN